MHEITIQVTDAQWKAMTISTPDPIEWVEGMVNQYANRIIDDIFVSEINRMSSDPSISEIPADKDFIVMQCAWKTAVERNMEVIAAAPWLASTEEAE
jgi:hypothetical protein